MQEIIEYSKENKKIISLFVKNISLILRLLIGYAKIRKSYINFREENLKNSEFWKNI